MKGLDKYDPENIEFELFEQSRRIRRAFLWIRLINIALIVFTLLALNLASRKIGMNRAIQPILIPAISVIIPLILMRSYPNLQIIPLLQIKRNWFSCKCSPVVILSMILLINFYYLEKYSWNESAMVILALGYIIAFYISIRPVIGIRAQPPESWSYQEMSIKIAIMFLLVVIMKYCYGRFPIAAEIDFYGFHIELARPLLALTVFLPFYLGLAASRLPLSNVKLTHGFESEQLRIFKR